MLVFRFRPSQVTRQVKNYPPYTRTAGAPANIPRRRVCASASGSPATGAARDEPASGQLLQPEGFLFSSGAAVHGPGGILILLIGSMLVPLPDPPPLGCELGEAVNWGSNRE